MLFILILSEALCLFQLDFNYIHCATPLRLIDLLKEHKKGAIPVIPPPHEPARGPGADEGRTGYSDPHFPEPVQPQAPKPTNPPWVTIDDYPAKGGGKGSNAKLLAIVASIAAVVALAIAAFWYFTHLGSPVKGMVEVKFAIDEQLQNPEVSVNGKPVKASYDANTSTITVYELTLGETSWLQHRKGECRSQRFNRSIRHLPPASARLIRLQRAQQYT